MDYTKKDYISDKIHNGWRANGGKNARQVWFRGRIFDSIVATGRHLKLASPIAAKKWVDRGYTNDLEIIVPFITKERAEKKFNETKELLINKVETEIKDLEKKLEELRNARFTA